MTQSLMGLLRRMTYISPGIAIIRRPDISDMGSKLEGAVHFVPLDRQPWVK